jgi:hypothetical protein
MNNSAAIRDCDNNKENDTRYHKNKNLSMNILNSFHRGRYDDKKDENHHSNNIRSNNNDINNTNIYNNNSNYNANNATTTINNNKVNISICSWISPGTLSSSPIGTFCQISSKSVVVADYRENNINNRNDNNTIIPPMVVDIYFRVTYKLPPPIMPER